MKEGISKIIIEESDILKLFNWRDNNKELVRNYNPFILEGNLMIGEDSLIYFKCEGDIIRYKLSSVINKTKALDFKYNRETWEVSNLWYNKVTFANNDLNSGIEGVITTHSSLMAYIQHKSKRLQEKEIKVIRVDEGSSKEQNKEKIEVKNNLKKLNKKRPRVLNIALDTPNKFYVKVGETSLKAKRSYNIHTNSWERGGHWRIYRDKQGRETKRVWIQPTQCKRKNNKDSVSSSKTEKIYKINLKTLNNTVDK